MGGTTLRAGQKHTLTTLKLQFKEFAEFQPLDESKRQQGPTMALEAGRLSTEHGAQLSSTDEVGERWIYVFVRKPPAGKSKKATIEPHELKANFARKYFEVDLQKHAKKDVRPPGTKARDVVELRIDPKVDRVFVCLSQVQLTAARLQAYVDDKTPAGAYATLVEQRCAEFRFDPSTDPFPRVEWKHVVSGEGDAVRAVVLADPVGFCWSIGHVYAKALREYHHFLENPELAAKRLLGQLAASVVTKYNADLLENHGQPLKSFNDYQEWKQDRLHGDAEFYGGQLGLWLRSGPYLQAIEDHRAAGQATFDQFFETLVAHQNDLYLTSSGLEFYGRVANEPTYWNELFEGTSSAKAEQWRRLKNVDSVFKATAGVMQGYWLGVLQTNGSSDMLKRLLPQLKSELGKDAYMVVLDVDKRKFMEEVLPDDLSRLRFEKHQARVLGTERLRNSAYKAEVWVKHTLLVMEVLNLALLVHAFGTQSGVRDSGFYYLELSKAITKTAGAAAHLLSGSKANIAKAAGKVAAVISVVGYGLKFLKALSKGDDAMAVAYAISTVGAVLALAATFATLPVVGWIGAILIVLGDLLIMLLRESDLEVWLKTCEWGKERKGLSTTDQLQALLPIVGKPAIKVELRDKDGKQTGDLERARFMAVIVEPTLYLHGETKFTLELKFKRMQMLVISSGIDRDSHSLVGPDDTWKVEWDGRRTKSVSAQLKLADFFEVDDDQHIPNDLIVSGDVVVDFMKNKSAQKKPVEFELDDAPLALFGKGPGRVPLL